MPRCRHNKAWPTIFFRSGDGFMWCPVCGAVRCVKSCGDHNGFAFSEPNWRVPGKNPDRKGDGA